MALGFRGHIVICGWNSRTPVVLENLLPVTRRPIVVIHTDLEEIVRTFPDQRRLFLVCGDSAKPDVLVAADVAEAYSVMVFAQESMGISTDARSIEIALAVEKIRSAVYSVLEVRDLRNKRHFSWTKVDDMVSEQKIAVCLAAQSIRHLVSTACNDVDEQGFRNTRERQFLDTYQRLIKPGHNEGQFNRIEIPWAVAQHSTFLDVLKFLTEQRISPVAFVGYKRHDVHSSVSTRLGISGSWKTDCLSNPPAKTKVSAIWEEWPSDDVPLGLLCIAQGVVDSETLGQQLTASLEQRLLASSSSAASQ